MNNVRLITSATTVSGVIPAGAIAIGFRAGHGGDNSLVDGVVPVTEALAFNTPVLPQGVVYEEIAYTVVSGTLYIAEVRE